MRVMFTLLSIGLVLFSCRKDDTTGEFISQRPDEFKTTVHLTMDYTNNKTFVHAYCYTVEEDEYLPYINYLAFDPNTFFSYDGTVLPTPWDGTYPELDGIVHAEVFFQNYDGNTYTHQVAAGDEPNFVNAPDTLYKGESLEISFAAPNNSEEDLIQLWTNGGPCDDCDTEYWSLDSSGTFYVNNMAYFTSGAVNTVLLTRTSGVKLDPWPGAGGSLTIQRIKTHSIYIE